MFYITIQLNNIILKRISTSFLKYNLVPALEFTFVHNPSDGSRDPSWFPRPLWRDDFASHMSFLVVDDLGSWSNQNVPQGVDKLTQKTRRFFCPQIPPMIEDWWGGEYACSLLVLCCFFLPAPFRGFEVNFTANPSVQWWLLKSELGSFQWFSTFLHQTHLYKSAV